MSSHPVRFRIEPPARLERIHVVIRLALLLALGMLGCSAVYWLLYLALPALVALFILQKGGERYLSDGAPRIVRGLRWLAGGYAYLWLLTDALPTTEIGGPLDFDVEVSGAPTAASALLRLVFSLPALLMACVLSLAATFLWLVGAIVVLINQRMPEAITDFLTLALRYQSRLIAYHLSLVERYPSLKEAPPAPAAA